MKLIFHCHTSKSGCAGLSEEDLIYYLNENSIDCVVVTDHNKITSLAWDGQKILGSEISTQSGDLIGIFITNEVSPGLSIKETAAEIHQQGGLVVAPHPGDLLRKEAMTIRDLEKNIPSIDIVEVENSRNFMGLGSKKAKEIAKKYKKPFIYGSDAHFIEELGNAYMELSEFKNPNEFLSNIREAKVYQKKSGLSPHLKTKLKKLSRRS